MLAEAMQVDIATIIATLAAALGVGTYGGHVVGRRQVPRQSDDDAASWESRIRREEKLMSDIGTLTASVNALAATIETLRERTHANANALVQQAGRISMLERDLARNDSNPISVGTGPNRTVGG